MVFNAYCMNVLLTEKSVQPRNTLVRMGIAFFLPILPLIIVGKVVAALSIVIIYGIGVWLFSQYPLGGWSHTAFHLVFFLTIPIYMYTSLDLAFTKSQIELVAKCTLITRMDFPY